jgi:proprotein convertase subtilisin/kexin type 5
MCNSNSNCTRCNSGFQLINGYCSTNCLSGFYSLTTPPSNCTACPINCKTCTSQHICTSCNIINSTIYYLFINTTVSTCISSCPNGYYIENGLCLRCSSTCSVCQSATNCSQCLFGFTLTNNICINSSSSNPCPSNCQYCHSINCLKCIRPFLLYINSLANTSTCVNNCPAGYYSGF